MSRYVEIINGTPLEVIVDRLKANPAGGIFRFSNHYSRANFFWQLTQGKIDWVKNNPETPDGDQLFTFENQGQCNIIIRLKENG